MKEYSLQIKEEEIIKGLLYDVKPVSTRNVIRNILKQDNKRASRARRKLDKFHDLLMEFLKTFNEARAFGMVTKEAPKTPKATKGNQSQ